MMRNKQSLLPLTNDLEQFGKGAKTEIVTEMVSSLVMPISLNIDLVTKKAKSHEEFLIESVAGSVHCQNLPEFEELYHVEKEEADRLLQKEIMRLQTAAAQPASEPFSWCGGFDNPPMRQEISRSTLLRVANHLWCNMAVLKFKNDLILLEHTRFCRHNEDVKSMYQQTLLSLRYSRGIILSNFVQASAFVATRRMPPLQPGTLDATVYDELVDYISASVYRLFIHSASGQSWTHSTMAVLARISRKLKDLKTNAARCAEECIDAIEFLHADLKDENSEDQKRFVFCHDSAETVDLLDDTYFIKSYFLNEFHYRSGICAIIARILRSLKENLSDSGGIPLSDNCEFSTLIEASSGMSALVIDSERRGNVRTTTRQMALAFTYNACRLLLPIAEHISKQNNKPQDIQGAAGIRWWWQRRHQGGPVVPIGGQGLAHLTSLGDCLSTIVHMVLTTSAVSNAMTNLADLLLSLPGQENEVIILEPPEGCRLAFTLSRSIARHEAWQEHTHIMTLPAYSLRQRPAEPADERSMTPGIALRFQYRDILELMSGWVFDSEAIVIKCRMVAAIIIVPALLVAGGGVALLLAPYHKPKGVDPSNFMIFLWSIAISYLLMAKAFFVPDWPWHDFLRAEVYCRSISEVGRITGIDRQLILMHVLANERKLSLRVRGPYAMLFSNLDMERAKSKSGFAIDVPITLDTVYASGYLVLKVITQAGPRLVFVDGRAGTSAYIATGTTLRSYVVAEDLEETPREKRQTSQRPMQLVSEDMSWKHNTVLGLYVNKSATFI
jgi:hypothetical protein